MMETKIDASKEFKNNTMLSTLILHCITKSDSEELKPIYLRENSTGENGVELDIELTINGINVDIISFLERVENRIDKEVLVMAKQLIKNKFFDISDMLIDLEGRVEEEVDKRLEDWEKE